MNEDVDDLIECRCCGAPVHRPFVDLGLSPLCETYLTFEQVNKEERRYPLRLYLCERCLLVQLPEYVSPEDIFSTDYPYYASYSDSWLCHAKEYVRSMIARLGLTKESRVIEIASNDGYLLQYFIEDGIPVLGVEPAANVAQVALQKGVPSIVRFFGSELAKDLLESRQQADLLIGNNVLAHTPHLNDFVRGLKILLKPSGVITMEFPHLLRLIEGVQFDTIYHEHFSYFSLRTVRELFARHGLTVFDVETLSTHGGSLRIYARHSEHSVLRVSEAVSRVIDREEGAGMTSRTLYESFGDKVRAVKEGLRVFLYDAKRMGKTVAGYGAPGKGNILLNYCGITRDLIEFTVDRNPIKQGKYTPGSHIPIFPTEKIGERRPDYLLILPWNLREEIMEQMSWIREWGGRFVIPIPAVQVV